jgi:hypothetical protein
MTKAPDFEQIADTLIHEAAMVVGALAAGTDCPGARRVINDLLREVWNARGAADVTSVSANLSGSDWHVRRLADALKTLDR